MDDQNLAAGEDNTLPTHSLLLQPPEEIPGGIPADTTPEVHQALDVFCKISALTTDKQALALVEEALRIIGHTDETVPAEGDLAPTTSKPTYEEYDRFFGVIRVTDRSARYTAVSLLVTYRNLLLEAEKGSSLAPSEWVALKASFKEMAEGLLFKAQD